MGAVQSQQFLICRQQTLFASFHRQRASFLTCPNCIIEPPRLGIGCRQGANHDGYSVLRQFAGPLGIFDGLNSISDAGVRTSRQQPGEIVQGIQCVRPILQRCLVPMERFYQFFP